MSENKFRICAFAVVVLGLAAIAALTIESWQRSVVAKAAIEAGYVQDAWGKWVRPTDIIRK